MVTLPTNPSGSWNWAACSACSFPQSEILTEYTLLLLLEFMCGSTHKSQCSCMLRPVLATMVPSVISDYEIRELQPGFVAVALLSRLKPSFMLTAVFSSYSWTLRLVSMRAHLYKINLSLSSNLYCVCTKERRKGLPCQINGIMLHFDLQYSIPSILWEQNWRYPQHPVLWHWKVVSSAKHCPDDHKICHRTCSVQ